MRRYITALLFATACFTGQAATPTTPKPPAPAPVAPNAELSPALEPLAWWLGDWRSVDGKSTEHWVAAAGAIYGVALHPNGFEALIVDDGEGPGKPDGILRLIAMPGGEKSVEFRQRLIKDMSATFANDAHDFPKAITYLREGDELRALLGGGDKSERFVFKRATAQPAPELEAADIAFSSATTERGVDGWVAAFEADGWMLRRGERIVGADAISKMMSPVLSSGKLVWNPIASGRSGDLGFTVGKATFTAATPGDSWRSTYVTIWRKQADGTWKVRFDTGRVVQD